MIGADLSALELAVLPRASFLGCLRLMALRMPAGLKGVGRAAFVSCGRVRDLGEMMQWEWIGATAFRGCGIRRFAGGEALREIGSGAFRWSALEAADLSRCAGELRLGGLAFSTAAN